MERLTIKERMASGRNQYIAKCREQGIKMGRPASYRKSEAAYREQYAKELSLLRKGISLRNVSALTGTSVNTLRKLLSWHMKKMDLGFNFNFCIFDNAFGIPVMLP